MLLVHLHGMQYFHIRTPANQQKHPPFLGQSAEDHDQQEVEHDTLAQHPAEGRQEEVLEEGSYKGTATLGVGPKY